MEPAREHALARTRLSLDEHGNRRGDDPRRLGRDLLDRGAFSEEGIDRLALLRGLAHRGDPPHATVLERTLDDHLQGRQLDGLGQELLGPLLDRLHREVDRAVRGEEDHGQRRVLALEGPQNVEPVAVAQGEVHDGRIEGLLARALECLSRTVRLDDLEALAAQVAAQGNAYVLLVVHDEDPPLRHRFAPGRSSL